MKKPFLLLAFALLLCSSPLASDETVQYVLLDAKAFEQTIVGNTVVGVTRQSKSLYMLYFAPDGISKLYKQDKVYNGSWWIDKDENGKDVVHAFWPDYTSDQPKSLFSPENPRYGNPTALLYYISQEHPNALLLTTNKLQVHALIVSGCAFSTATKQ